MSTFGQQGRDLSGWKDLLELHQSIYAKKELKHLQGMIEYEQQMPYTSPDMSSSIDIRAGTSVKWNMEDDELDHHWEMRRIDRLAPAWRSLLPSQLDSTGYADAECWIEINSKEITAYIHRNDDDDSTLALSHKYGNDGCWDIELEISFVWTGSDSEALFLCSSPSEALAQVEEKGWNLSGYKPYQAIVENDEMKISVPIECIGNIDSKQLGDARISA